ncbi:potassium channel family protein [Histidinibacterium aquaticum]|uniref:potassium channel family protein n=1 Tax=Histidinibacterium aquaticum TaxID=2613962 RepID=UPI00168A68B2|nr:TrkA family potassium uptake protein [Histidinibacterium aquaticum]
MRIVIVGASRFGVATAEQLTGTGHEVVLVDTDGDRLKELSETLDCGFIEGDGSLPTVQRDAFADHADALVLLTNEDDVNILAALVGKSVGFERVVPQIVRRELMSVCEELGLADLITPHATVARSIVRALEDHDDPSLDLRVHKDFDVLGYHVCARHVDQTVGELDLPSNTRIIAVTRGEDDLLVTEETKLKKGDRLIVAVGTDAEDRMDQIFEPDDQDERQD